MKIIRKFNLFNENINIDELDNGIVKDTIEDHSDKSEIKSNEVDSTEEEGQYEGTKKLNQLASELGTEVVDNAINYEGKKINFYSETEKFHVDNKKFKTIEEVLNYLNISKETTLKEEPLTESLGCCCSVCSCETCECECSDDPEFRSWLEENQDFLKDEYGEYFKDSSINNDVPQSFNKWAESKFNSENTNNQELDSEFQAFGLKDNRINWPREEEAMERYITKKFINFK